MWEEMKASWINSLLIQFDVRPERGRVPTPSTKSKSYGYSITPEGSEEHLLRVYQNSGGREPNDRWSKLWWIGVDCCYYTISVTLWVHTQTSWGQRRRVIEGDPRIPELNKGPIKGPLTCIPGFFKWPWPQVVEKAPNWGFFRPPVSVDGQLNV